MAVINGPPGYFETADTNEVRKLIKHPRARQANGATILWVSDMDKEPDEGWLVKHVLPARGVGLLAGQSGMGKTYLTLDLSQCVILGTDFAGHRVDRTGGVLLFAAEAPHQVRKRWRGLEKAKIRPWFDDRGEDLPRVPMGYVDVVPRLQADDALGKMLAICAEMRAALREQYECDLILIIVDTLSAAADFRDHNDAAEAQKVMNMLSRLSQEVGALVLVVDHFGKDADRGVRGSSAKEASADFVLSVLGEKAENGVAKDQRLVVRKLRGGAAGVETRFALATIQMGTDDDGEPITELVVRWSEKQSAGPRGWSDRKFTILRMALDEALDAHGYETQPSAGYPTVRAVKDEFLRDIFYKIYPPTGDDAVTAKSTLRQAYHRAMRAARDNRLIASYRLENGDVLVWKVERDMALRDRDTLNSVTSREGA